MSNESFLSRLLSSLRGHFSFRNRPLRNEPPLPPYPKNAPGDFYVEDGCCTACEAPLYEAPGLMALDGYHCYFKKQPETPNEVERAIMACVVSCVRAVRYGGDDPKILERFRELRASGCVTRGVPEKPTDPPPK